MPRATKTHDEYFYTQINKMRNGSLYWNKSYNHSYLIKLTKIIIIITNIQQLKPEQCSEKYRHLYGYTLEMGSSEVVVLLES